MDLQTKERKAAIAAAISMRKGPDEEHAAIEGTDRSIHFDPEDGFFFFHDSTSVSRWETEVKANLFAACRPAELLTGLVTCGSITIMAEFVSVCAFVCCSRRSWKNSHGQFTTTRGTTDSITTIRKQENLCGLSHRKSWAHSRTTHASSLPSTATGRHRGGGTVFVCITMGNGKYSAADAVSTCVYIEQDCSIVQAGLLRRFRIHSRRRTIDGEPLSAPRFSGSHSVESQCNAYAQPSVSVCSPVSISHGASQAHVSSGSS